ncbi:hypothetical protein GGX14DRAFT_663171 [Mycena pura]|uniref:Uncharacterized protein n=1 Tax=Mycena pura TaxID=153505 RepID=A0AAD6VVI6_9AGAR|nr:hypothetical protein GGX14DRAFT_663171 [Mycena pura]
MVHVATKFMIRALSAAPPHPAYCNVEGNLHSRRVGVISMNADPNSQVSFGLYRASAMELSTIRCNNSIVVPDADFTVSPRSSPTATSFSPSSLASMEAPTLSRILLGCAWHVPSMTASSRAPCTGRGLLRGCARARVEPLVSSRAPCAGRGLLHGCARAHIEPPVCSAAQPWQSRRCACSSMTVSSRALALGEVSSVGVRALTPPLLQGEERTQAHCVAVVCLLFKSRGVFAKPTHVSSACRRVLSLRLPSGCFALPLVVAEDDLLHAAVRIIGGASRTRYCSTTSWARE